MKDIPGYEGFYAVTEDGRVFSYRSNRFLNDYDNGNGYRYLTFSVEGKRKNEFVHRLMAKTYVCNFSENLDVNHINGNKNDNRIVNLECVTRKENVEHALKIGLITKEILAYNGRINAKLNRIFSNEQIKTIKEAYKNGIRVFELAEINKCSWSTIDGIVKNRSYREVV